MKTPVTVFLFFFFALPVFAKNPLYSSAETSLKQASDLETRQQQLRYYEQQLAEREQTIFGKLETAQQQQQEERQQAAEREDALRRSLQQQQEQANTQAFRTQLQQQQDAARRREAELQGQMDEQRKRAAYERLQQGMQLSTLQSRQYDRQSQTSGQQSPQTTKAYGYADRQIPRERQGQEAGGSVQPVQPAPHLTDAPPKTRILIFDAPPPLATIAALESILNTTVNGIDHIETKAVLPETLSVEQLDTVKKIADNGTLIARQRLGLEQYQLDADTQLSRLRVVKSFVLWGLLCSIPSLLTVYWIARNIAIGRRKRQQEQLSYQLKELERVERQINGRERQFDAHHQR